MTAAQAHIVDTLDRAQLCWEQTVDIAVAIDDRREAIALLIHHITSAVLLEHLRRLDPELADRLCPWLLGEDGVFSDGYAGELLYQWREQLAAGRPLNPIGPDEERTA